MPPPVPGCAGMPVRVLGVNGSARRYGNTFKLLKAAMIAAEETGAETRLIHLYDYHIEPCRGCYSDNKLECHYPKKCPIYEGTGDRFHEIAQAFLEADAVVIATPVYWFMASGQLKNMFDRLTALENMVYHVGYSLLDGKVAGMIASGEEAGGAMALAWMALTLNMMGFHVPAWGTAYYHGEDPLTSPQAVDDAYNVGRNVVLFARILRGERIAVERWYEPLPEEERRRIVEAVRREAEEEREKARRERTWL